jgi:hypothetical protein
MSYLAAPRLVFAGRFLSDVSTINNEPENFQPGSEVAEQWNPGGGATFDFVSCRVTGGTPATSGDPVLGLAVTGAADRPGGKMVDLDPGWQASSEIWGLGIRLADPATGEEALRGEFRVASFRDLWTRQIREIRAGRLVNGQPSGARYVSVVEEVRWGPAADRSPLLQALREEARGGGLSIALHQFGYFYTTTHGRHATGTVIGVIGPHAEGESRTSLVARRIRPTVVGGLLPGRPGGTLVGPIDFEIDAARGAARLDIGHALPIDDVDGTISDIATLLPALADIRGLAVGLEPEGGLQPGTVLAAEEVELVGDLPAPSPGWYRSTGGIADLPMDGAMLARAADTRLALFARLEDGRLMRLSVETDDGLFLRTDHFVRRLDPGDTAHVTFHARRFGRPAPDIAIHLRRVMPDGPGAGLSFPSTVTTGEDGTARLELTASDPGNPRGAVDGEVFAIAYAAKLDEAGEPDPAATGLEGIDIVAVHVRDAFAASDPPSFHEDVRPIMEQYAQLYPIMSKHLFDLADYDALVRYRSALLLAFGRPVEDPNHMPVTRDLSRAKLAAITAWLSNETGDPAEPLRRGVAPPLRTAETAGAALAGALRSVREDAKAREASLFGSRSGVLVPLPEPKA